MVPWGLRVSGSCRGDNSVSGSTYELTLLVEDEVKRVVPSADL